MLKESSCFLRLRLLLFYCYLKIVAHRTRFPRRESAFTIGALFQSLSSPTLFSLRAHTSRAIVISDWGSFPLADDLPTRGDAYFVLIRESFSRVPAYLRLFGMTGVRAKRARIGLRGASFAPDWSSSGSISAHLRGCARCRDDPYL